MAESTTQPRSRAEPRQLRRMVRLLSTALLAYGVLSLGMAIVGGVAAWRLGEELRTTTAALDQDLASMQRTLEASATALADAAATADELAPTLDLVKGPLASAATTAGAAASTIDTLATTLADFEVLGLQPFGSVAEGLAGTADDLATLASDLESLGTSLPSVGGQLEQTATSLRVLSTELATLADGLGSGRVTAALEAAVDLAIALLWILAAWLAILAAGSLLFGFLLWRMQADSRRHSPAA